MQTVGVVCNLKKPQVLDAFHKIKEYLSEKKFHVIDSRETSLESLVADSDLIITLGGDGTLLNLSRFVSDRMPPVMGVNLGSLGFITDIKIDEVFDEVEIFLSGKSRLEDRFMIDVSITNTKDDSDFEVKSALNDIVLHREALSPFAKITLKVGNDLVYTVKGDGLIFSTPTGSTAYNLSCNGPIVHPPAENIIVTPISHHSLIQKSIVLSPTDKVTFDVEGKDDDKPAAQLMIDGQIAKSVYKGEILHITASLKKFPLLRNSRRSYFNVLKEKFNWGPES